MTSYGSLLPNRTKTPSAKPRIVPKKSSAKSPPASRPKWMRTNKSQGRARSSSTSPPPRSTKTQSPEPDRPLKLTGTKIEHVQIRPDDGGQAKITAAYRLVTDKGATVGSKETLSSSK